MSGTAAVLQEYMVKLGFQTDAISLKRFADGLSDTSKKILNVGASVAGVVAGVEAASMAFAFHMRKMYFASELAGTTATNMQAVAYAAEKVGISGDQMESTITSLGTKLRSDPGMLALARNITGVNEAGKDTTQVLMDLMHATKGMTPWAQQLRLEKLVDPNTVFMLRSHLGDFAKYQQEFKRIQKESGVDPQQAKDSTLHYAAQLDQLELRMKSLSAAAMIGLQPFFDKLASGTNELLQSWTTFFNKMGQVDPKTGKTKLATEWAEKTKDKNLLGKINAWGDMVDEAFGIPVTPRSEFTNNLGTNSKPSINSIPLGLSDTNGKAGSGNQIFQMSIHIDGAANPQEIGKAIVDNLITQKDKLDAARYGRGRQ